MPKKSTKAETEGGVAAAAEQAPKAKKSKTLNPAAGRPVVYPDVTAEVWSVATGNPVTAGTAKTMMGWEEEQEGSSFGDDYMLVDETGKKVRCAHNTHNRPFDERWSRRLAQDVLRGHWRLNGETVVLGATGLVLSAQHRLTALVLADQMWHADPHWKKAGPWKDGPPTMDVVVVTGVDESGDTTKTLDNVKPRTLEDVLYADVGMFAKAKPAERKKMIQATAFAVKELWHRVGRDLDAYAPGRTHSEALEFIDRHPGVKKCVEHVCTENNKTPPPFVGSKTVSPGVLSGLCYLMGVSGSDGAKYRAGSPPSEKRTDTGNMDKAMEYVSLLAGESPDVVGVRKALAALYGEDGQRTPTRDERQAVVVLGWGEFLEHGKVTSAKHCEPEWKEVLLDDEDPDGVKVLRLAKVPDVGGIDLGEPEEDAPAEDADEADPVTVETPKQQYQRLKEAYPGQVLVFRGAKQAGAWAADAKLVAHQEGATAVKDEKTGMLTHKIAMDDVDAVVTRLLAAGHKVVVVTPGEDGTEQVTEAKAA